MFICESQSFETDPFGSSVGGLKACYIARAIPLKFNFPNKEYIAFVYVLLKG